MTRLRGGARVLLAIAIAGVVLAPVPAQADSFGNCVSDPSNVGCLADNRVHAWCFASTAGGNKPNVRRAMRRATEVLNNQTVMITQEADNCNTATDLQWREARANGSRGLWDCFTGFQSGNVCRRGFAIIDSSVIARDGGPYQLNLNKTAVHEIGHSVGMRHHPPPYNDAMVSMRVFRGHNKFNGHHVGHVRRNY